MKTHLLALSVLSLAIVISSLAGPILRFLARRLMSAHSNKQPVFVDILLPPFRLIPFILAIHFFTEHFFSSDAAMPLYTHTIRSLVVVMIFWMLFRAAGRLDGLFQRMHLNFAPSAQEWIIVGVKILMAFLGVAMVLQVWGIPVAPIVASLGVLGVGVGLAAKDLFTNLISGILIMSERRFRPGEWIKVNGVIEGTVERIDFRSTRIRQFDLTPAYVPNSLLSDNAMVNYSRMSYRRIYWMIGLEYSTRPAQFIRIRDDILDYLHNDSRYVQPDRGTMMVRVDNFGESSINLMIYCFTKTTNWDEWLGIKEELALKLIEIVDAAGTGFAFPSRSLYIKPMAQDIHADTADTAEIFDPDRHRLSSQDISAKPVAQPSKTRQGPNNMGEADGE